MELFVDENGQVPQAKWIETIDALEKKTEPSSKAELKTALDAAIKSRIPVEKCALLLSGGVDSSYLALRLKELGANFTCYTVGIEGSPDLEYASDLVKELQLEHVKKTLSLEDVHMIMQKIAPWYLSDGRLKDENFAVLFGVAAVEYAAAELLTKDGIHIVFGGLGSEEIFAGYLRHEQSDDINQECWRGLKAMWRRDLIRDCILAGKFGLDVRTPLLDPGVIVKAMGIPSDLKIKGDIKKFILREIAADDGLPERFAWRKKLGAQYGSKMDKAIAKLAKQHGFVYKAEYLQSLVNLTV